MNISMFGTGWEIITHDIYFIVSNKDVSYEEITYIGTENVKFEEHWDGIFLASVKGKKGIIENDQSKVSITKRSEKKKYTFEDGRGKEIKNLHLYNADDELIFRFPLEAFKDNELYDFITLLKGKNSKIKLDGYCSQILEENPHKFMYKFKRIFKK